MMTQFSQKNYCKFSDMKNADHGHEVGIVKLFKTGNGASSGIALEPVQCIAIIDTDNSFFQV
jgi:hypothetical protein